MRGVDSLLSTKKRYGLFYSENHTAYVKVIIYQWIFNQHNMVCCEICQEPGMNVLYESNECEKKLLLFPFTLCSCVCGCMCGE